MKKSRKIITIIIGLVFLIIIGFPFLRFIFEMASFEYDLEKHMKIGQKYLDSLTDKDIQVWIQRSEKYLKDDPTTNTMEWDDKPVPPELEQLKIVDIEVLSNEVDYVWVGGMDHTELDVERMTDGSFQFVAVYNNYSNRVIWPKTANGKNLQSN
jgi:hypothetical protein